MGRYWYSNTGTGFLLACINRSKLFFSVAVRVSGTADGEGGVDFSTVQQVLHGGAGRVAALLVSWPHPLLLHGKDRHPSLPPPYWQIDVPYSPLETSSHFTNSHYLLNQLSLPVMGGCVPRGRPRLESLRRGMDYRPSQRPCRWECRLYAVGVHFSLALPS